MTGLSTLDPDDLPRSSSRPLAIRLHPPAERAVRQGHPWVFGNSIRSTDREGRAGDVAVIFDRKNRFLAVGLFDPSGPIRIRILSHGEPAQVGPQLFRRHLESALDRRRGLMDAPDTDGFRILHGEADRFPGLILDRYGDALVLMLYSSAWLPRLAEFLPAVRDLLEPRVLIGLTSRNLAADPRCPPALRNGALLLGEEDPGPFPFLESGLRFEAHPLEGHKTGFYLDQRDNRRRLVSRVHGARVLNVFSYTGAFSLYAARGGAREVTSVDRSAPALRQARRHFDLNPETAAGVAHETLEGDAFRLLDALAGEGRTFDVVVVDPPSFAKETRQIPRALDAYGSLTRLALRVLNPGGLLVQASCSSRVSDEDFFACLHRAADSGGYSLEEEERTGHPLDHPATFPEGAYLKCLWARAG